MAYVICEPCGDEKCGECTLVCPTNCIYDARDQYVIDPMECIDCAACASVCPVDAIYHLARVPGEWRRSVTRNADFFASLVD
ncbi:MAG TPA: 4Fe-4S binding protein [Armatimonadota bacterium]|nr:4Fe-4S binding protein [Armatimonadota bacterium]